MKKPQPVRNRVRFPFPLKPRKWKKSHVSLNSVNYVVRSRVNQRASVNIILNR